MNAEPITVRRLGLGLAITAALLTAGCAAGQEAGTANQQATIDGVNRSIGQVGLRALAVTAPSGPFYKPGSVADVKLVIVNSGSSDDSLMSITSSSATGWAAYRTSAEADQAATDRTARDVPTSPTPQPETSVPIPAGGRVSWGVPEATGTLQLIGTKGEIYPGTVISLTFTFQKAGTITVAVPIQLTSTAGTAVVPAPSATGQEG